MLLYLGLSFIKKYSKIDNPIINNITLIQVNKSNDNNIKEAIIKKANKNDCLKAAFTDLKTSSFFKPTNLIKNPSIDAVPVIDKNNEK